MKKALRLAGWGHLAVLVVLSLAVGALPLCAGEEDFANGRYGGKPLFLKDGVFQGTFFFITVSVKVEKRAIAEIRILHHGNGGRKYEAMVEPLLQEMVDSQSTVVDAVTGATISSRNLRRAVREALLKSGGKISR